MVPLDLHSGQVWEFSIVFKLHTPRRSVLRDVLKKKFRTRLCLQTNETATILHDPKRILPSDDALNCFDALNCLLRVDSRVNYQNEQYDWGLCITAFLSFHITRSTRWVQNCTITFDNELDGLHLIVQTVVYFYLSFSTSMSSVCEFHSQRLKTFPRVI